MSVGREIVVDQNTEAWKALREGRDDDNLFPMLCFGASAAYKVCWLDPNDSAVSFFWEIHERWDSTIRSTNSLLAPPDKDRNTNHGHATEPFIISDYQLAVADTDGLRVVDGNMWVLEEFKWFYRVSPDGKVVDSEGNMVRILECKAPTSEMYSEPKDAHICQMHMQMWATGMTECDYAVGFAPVKPDDVLLDMWTPEFSEFKVWRIKRSEDYIRWMKQRFFYFTICLLDDVEPDPAMYVEPPPPVHYTLIYNQNSEHLLVYE